jgi:hypothetical protein
LNFLIFSNQLFTVVFEPREVEETDTSGCYNFICGLFSDTVSSLDYIALNGGMNSEMNWKECGLKRSWLNLRKYRSVPVD